MINSRTLELGRQFQDTILFDLNKRGISFSNYTSKKFQYEVGENTAGIEIKHDMQFRTTGNLFIEIETKTKNNNWIKSGIFRDDNSWLFLIGDEKKYWIFGKKSLQRILTDSNLNPVLTSDSKGYLLPIKQADIFSERVIENRG
tara:strand:+ start:317 stop:748 length:432 start_codon:yes stop_codon:yes gene_type:complete